MLEFYLLPVYLSVTFWYGVRKVLHIVKIVRHPVDPSWCTLVAECLQYLFGQ